MNIDVRKPQELQRAHDLLVGFLFDADARNQLPPGAGVRIAAAADVLCWVLHHDHNPTFANLMLNLEGIMASHGLELKFGGGHQ